MRIILQSLESGETSLVECSSPLVGPTEIRVRSSVSLVSTGTERMLLEFGKASLVGKALQQPQRVKEVVDKIRSEGLFTTWDSVNSKLNQLIPLGYSNVGCVEEVGSQVQNIRVGDRVLSNGYHADSVVVPINLAAPIPSSVSDIEASFGVVGSIALQGVREAEIELGERVAVIGVGLIGNLAAQFARASGATVTCLDINDRNLALCYNLGMACINTAWDRKGQTLNEQVDCVVLCSASKNSEPVELALRILRPGGRLVITGTADVKLDRDICYRKQIVVKFSMSYGPGRYDKAYESASMDYPETVTKWTVNRNLRTVLHSISIGQIDVSIFPTVTWSFEAAPLAYSKLLEREINEAVLFTYPADTPYNALKKVKSVNSPRVNSAVSEFSDSDEANFLTEKRSLSVSFLGMGNYARKALVPAFVLAGSDLCGVYTRSGFSARNSKDYEFQKQYSDPEEIFHDSVNTIVIATRHDTHAYYLLKALDKKIDVFIEKPLCLDITSCNQIIEKIEYLHEREFFPIITLGYNRRESFFAIEAKSLIQRYDSPKNIIYTVMTATLSPDNWTMNPDTGGGRFVSEGCHFIDFVIFLLGKKTKPISGSLIRDSSIISKSQSFVVTLRFDDGSIATINYVCTGHRSFPKEKIQVHVAGKYLEIDNFKQLSTRGFGSVRLAKPSLFTRQDKGQNRLVQKHLDRCAVVPESRSYDISPVPIYESLLGMNILLSLNERGEWFASA